MVVVMMMMDFRLYCVQCVFKSAFMIIFCYARHMKVWFSKDGWISFEFEGRKCTCSETFFILQHAAGCKRNQVW